MSEKVQGNKKPTPKDQPPKKVETGRVQFRALNTDKLKKDKKDSK